MPQKRGPKKGDNLRRGPTYPITNESESQDKRSSKKQRIQKEYIEQPISGFDFQLQFNNSHKMATDYKRRAEIDHSKQHRPQMKMTSALDKVSIQKHLFTIQSILDICFVILQLLIVPRPNQFCCTCKVTVVYQRRLTMAHFYRTMMTWLSHTLCNVMPINSQ